MPSPSRTSPTRIEEFHVAHSNALHARLDGDSDPYVVGPLARYSLNSRPALARSPRTAAREAGLGPTCRNPFRSIVVRAVELVEAYDEALRIIDGWTGSAAPSVAVPPRAGEGFGASEAPRGVLFHRYVLDDTGIIRDAQIVPPDVAEPAPASRPTCARWSQAWSDLDDHALLHRCEQAIRNYDPCISCATHFLDLTVDRG